MSATEGAATGGTGTADYRAIYQSMKTPQLITEVWETQTDPILRDQIMGLLATRQMTEGAAAWPSAAMAAREEMAGLYPDPEDPQFAARLFEKREFYESRAIAASVAEGSLDPCSSAAVEQVFELTPVQRIVTRFLHPLTPYMGLLVNHGVGVGKTCTAVSIAEQFLEIAPTRQVIVVAPQALQENFEKTVFDPAKLRWDAQEGHWTTQQCTGTSYLERLDLMTTRELKTVAFKVAESRRSRYKITGYLELANWIERTLRSQTGAITDPTQRRIAEDRVLGRLFSDHLIIIDEAHNLRDTAADAAAEPAPTEAAGKENEAKENDAGKALNPYLKRICLNAEGMRLVLMTATPMYNAAPEICLLLNYLIMNDEKSDARTLRPDVLFTKDGDLKPGGPTKALARIARRYVTYMRGENPYTFPLRMRPLDASPDAIAEWPTISASKRPVVFTPQEESVIRAMPFVFTDTMEGSPPETKLIESTQKAIELARLGATAEVKERAADPMLDQRMQMANITYPNESYGGAGWTSYFVQKSVEEQVPSKTLGGRPQKRVSYYYEPRDPATVDSIFMGENLRQYAPKMHRIVESVKSAQGICFVFSQYIKAGALPMAIALERAGFQRRMADGKLAPLLQGMEPVAPICSICGQRDGGPTHGGADHPFRPACYVLLTSEEAISPSFDGLVRQASSWRPDDEWGPVGSNVKVIIGSRVASEGLDLKCIREMHVMDAWYHLNRTEQIIGRAIRYCSHTALRAVEQRRGLPPMSMNNCLIYLHMLRVPSRGEDQPAFETADMYAYRTAIGKALMVGRVQRLLKTHAWDCNLELEAIIFAGLPPRPQVDAQGNDRRSVDDEGKPLEGYSINDQDYTTYCDYQACKHECAVSVPRTKAEGLREDSSTFTVSDARRLVLAKQQVVRELFKEQVVVPESVVQDVFSDLPWEIASEALMELLDGRRFRLRRPDSVEGFLLKKAGYVVFQPAAVTDTDIPISMRYARAFQIRRRFMEPSLPVLARGEEAPPPPPAPVVVRAASAVTEVGEEAEGPPAPAVPVAVPSATLSRWKEWTLFVDRQGKIPPPMSARELFKKDDVIAFLSTLMDRFKDFPQSRLIALRWWFDRQSLEDQRVLLEAALDSGDSELNATLANDLFSARKTTLAYRVFNPVTATTEYYCRSAGAPVGTAYRPCDSSIADIVAEDLNATPVKIPGSTGTLLGFMASKKDSIIFKSLDTTTLKKASLVGVGAECGNSSNLPPHRARVRMLQEAARETDLAPLLWEDSGDKAPAKAGGPITHINDLTHQLLCMYMEWLTRIMDAREVAGRRWFLTAAAADAAGLKGRGT